MQVTIDTSSREEAELIASLLPRPATAHAVRGYGFVRVFCKNAKERNQILDAVGVVAADQGLSWLRVRWDDDAAGQERVFRQGQPAF
jgi:hypothetical protein